MLNTGAIATAAQFWPHDPKAAEATRLAFRFNLAPAPRR
jgi:hypothetical protein